MKRYLAFRDQLIPDFDRAWTRGPRDRRADGSRLRLLMTRLAASSSALERDPGDVTAFLTCVVRLEAMARELAEIEYPVVRSNRYAPPVEGLEAEYEVAKVMEE